ncbi:MAG TPA: hypothetical protein VKR83_03410 [Ktedonobacteraceae bacterium]|nr:hypothetical protein [Ktedonobacteraceae bacterium]
MAYEVTIRLTDREYALLAAEAAKSGKQPEILLRDLIQHFSPVPQEKRLLTEGELAECLYHDGKVLNLPDRKVLTAEERARRERLARVFAGGKPASEMVKEDRGPY